MTNTNWHSIWNKRRLQDCSNISLAELISLDGFDTGAGRIEENDWLVYAKSIADKLSIKDNSSVFEVGCGSGAFLFAILNFYSIKPGGIDYSQGLIDAASIAMPNGDFSVLEASLLPTDTKYDYILSNGVFHYFSLDYAETVMAKIVDKLNPTGKIALTEIPDLKTKNESELARRDALSPKEYQKKYEGLSHTYYSRSWFSDIADKYDLTATFFDGCVPNYIQNKYRFGVILEKV